MYYKKAIDRINKIDWTLVGSRVGEDEQKMGFQYLCKMANFVERQHIEPTNPLLINIAKILGDVDDNDYLEDCKEQVRVSLKNKTTPRYIINFYLQLAHYSDEKNEVATYLQIYDPMICLLERGYSYGFREGGLMIYHAEFYQLSGWYDIFINSNFAHKK